MQEEFLQYVIDVGYLKPWEDAYFVSHSIYYYQKTCFRIINPTLNIELSHFSTRGINVSIKKINKQAFSVDSSFALVLSVLHT